MNGAEIALWRPSINSGKKIDIQNMSLSSFEYNRKQKMVVVPVQGLFIEDAEAECLMQIALKFSNYFVAAPAEPLIQNDDVPNMVLQEQETVAESVSPDVIAVYINRGCQEVAITYDDEEIRLTYCRESTTFTHLIEAVYEEIGKLYDDMHLHLEFFVENVISDTALERSIWEYKVEDMPILQGSVVVMC